MNDQLVGTITTGTYGHTLGGPVGLGWVTLPANTPDKAAGNQRYELLVAGTKVSARASLKAMYDPQNEKIRH